MSTGRGVYGYGKGDGLIDIHGLYEVIEKGPSQRQRAYKEYVCSNRDKEELEIRKKIAKGIIGTVGFQEQMDKEAIQIRRPRRGRPRK